MTEETKTPTSATSVNQLWLQNVYAQMTSLKTGLALARDGLMNLEEAMQLPEEELFSVQMRNFRIIVTLFDSLIDDCQPVLDKEYYKKSKKNLKQVKGYLDTTPQLFYKVKSNQRHLNANYYKVIEELNTMRGKLIMELKSILYLFNPNSNKGIY